MTPDQQARILRVAKLCRDKGISQEEIADRIGASQSQVSRVLSGRGRRFSRLSEEVCCHVERLIHEVSISAVRENSELISAIRETWDGSSAHAKALAAVIRSLAALHGGRAAKENAN